MALKHRLIGRATRLYWWVTRPRTFGVRALVVDPRGRVALVRHTYKDHWYLPGGGVKRGEGAEAGIARELAEEIGLTRFAVEKVQGVYHNRREFKDDHVVLYVTRVDESAAEAVSAVDTREVEEVRWFEPDDLPENVTPATARRVHEHRTGAVNAAAW